MSRLNRVVLAAVLSLAALSGSVFAGPVGGLVGGVYTVLARDYDLFRVRCYGGEVTTIVVSGDGDTDLDVIVYDENGRLIASDTAYGDDCVVRFRPRWTGTFQVKVVNLGYVHNNYVLAIE